MGSFDETSAIGEEEIIYLNNPNNQDKEYRV